MEFNGPNYVQPPAESEIEISVFGPGFGESVVAHLGQKQWLVIDSCLNRDTGNPAALDYLNAIGVPHENVVLVVASHSDSDHIRGLAAILRHCTGASFVTSAAMSSEEFRTLLGNWRAARVLAIKGGLDEMNEIYEILRDRAGDTKFPAPLRASSQRRLWYR